jgi:hypothetical protein
MSTEEKKESTHKTERQPHRIRLPGFIKEGRPLKLTGVTLSPHARANP